MLRPKIGLDWDDVTAPFNSIAIDMANRKYNILPQPSRSTITIIKRMNKNKFIMKY